MTRLHLKNDEHVCNLGDFLLTFEDVFREDHEQLFSLNKEGIIREILDIFTKSNVWKIPTRIEFESHMEDQTTKFCQMVMRLYGKEWTKQILFEPTE